MGGNSRGELVTTARGGRGALSPALAGSRQLFSRIPGACAPGFILTPASQVKSAIGSVARGAGKSIKLGGASPRVYFKSGLVRYFLTYSWGLRPRLYSDTCFAG